MRAIAKLTAAHHRKATPAQHLVDLLITLVAHPAFIAAALLAVTLWIGGNLALRRLAGWSLDRPAFPWLQGAGELSAILITALVLISQRRKDELSELREQLTLELAILSERRGAKLIALMEEMRRDNPMIANRVDREAEDMATPADPEQVLEASRDAHGRDAAEAETE